VTIFLNEKLQFLVSIGCLTPFLSSATNVLPDSPPFGGSTTAESADKSFAPNVAAFSFLENIFDVQVKMSKTASFIV
jgi:hypothetical protein